MSELCVFAGRIIVPVLLGLALIALYGHGTRGRDLRALEIAG